MEKLPVQRNPSAPLQLLHVSSGGSVNSDSDDSGFSPSEEMDKLGPEQRKEILYPENHRRFSTTCAPSSEGFKEISIPSVVVTSHDEEESDCASSNTSLTDKRNRLRRSLSSPDSLLPSHSVTEEPSHFRNNDFVVTLEDVEKFKLMRKKSGSISGGSNIDERLNSDDTWSYTNFSSSQASDSEFASEREDVCGKYQKEPGETETKKTSPWKKVRPVIHVIPFVQMFKHKKYPWVQLAGHPGNFLRGLQQGTVLKKYNPCEADCYQLLMSDPLAEVVPRYHGVSSVEDGRYTEIQCCLDTFNTPNICDVKMGVRTFLEGEAAITKPRHDLYLKMIKEDSAAPTESEKAAEAITKFRYLDWRDRVSSSRSLGFRVEALTVEGKSCRNFKTKREAEEVETVLKSLVTNELVRSSFFSTHEIIGSSLLFVNDESKASVWMIDFEKTRKYEGEHKLEHNKPWELNNHEDGYLLGLQNLISLFENL